jgi:hypothetical protein
MRKERKRKGSKSMEIKKGERETKRELSEKITKL